MSFDGTFPFLSICAVCVCMCIHIYMYIYYSGLNVTSAQGSLQRPEVATACISSLHCQNVKLLPIMSSQGGANKNDGQAT